MKYKIIAYKMQYSYSNIQRSSEYKWITLTTLSLSLLMLDPMGDIGSQKLKLNTLCFYYTVLKETIVLHKAEPFI